MRFKVAVSVVVFVAAAAAAVVCPIVSPNELPRANFRPDAIYRGKEEEEEEEEEVLTFFRRPCRGGRRHAARFSIIEKAIDNETPFDQRWDFRCQVW